MDKFTGKLAVQQRVLPSYRVPFFETLASQCTAGFEVFAGKPMEHEAIGTANRLINGRLAAARNIHLLSGSLYMCWQSGFIAWLERFQPDVLIVEANPRYISTPPAIEWMHNRRHLVIGWGLGAPAMHGPLAGMRRRSRNHFLAQLDAVIAYSRQGASEYADSGVPLDRIFVAPNSAAFRPVKEMVDRPVIWRGRPQILFVGRLQTRKRLDLLFQACAALPVDLQPDVTIVGDGPDRAALEALAAKTYTRVVFAGMKTGNALEPYFQQADLFIMPGTGGLAIQQAMAYGLPVIVGQGDGSQGQLVRPENGWIVAPGRLQELVSAIRQALSNPAALRKMGRESYRIARDEINIEMMVDGFLQAVHSVAAR